MVLVIDPDPIARANVRAALPADWAVLEASDGLSGIDLARLHQHKLRLVVLELRLPDIDGRSVCLRLRTLHPGLAILPFTSGDTPFPELTEFGCHPSVLKPSRPDLLACAVRAAQEQPPPLPTTCPLMRLAQEQSAAIERLVRQQRTALRVLVFTRSALRQAGIAQMLGSLAQAHTAAQLPALELMLGQRRWDALIADADAFVDVVDLARESRVPLILLAADAAQAIATTASDVACVLQEHEPLLATHLAEALTALAAGRRPLIRLPEPTGEHSSRRVVVPPDVARRLAAFALTSRELDVLWLDYQGLTSEQIAQVLQINRTTVTSHWKRVRKRLDCTRAQARAWMRSHLQAAPFLD